eukprot:1150796-Pelagomonas_calceolata.AAC.8
MSLCMGLPEWPLVSMHVYTIALRLRISVYDRAGRARRVLEPFSNEGCCFISFTSGTSSFSASY